MPTLDPPLARMPLAPHHVHDKRLDALGWGALLLSVAVTLPIIPDWPHRHPFDPPYAATAGFVLMVLALLGLRIAGHRGSRLERRLVSVFLASMPVVYLSNLLLSSTRGVWLPVELAGVALFAGTAWLGLKRSAWFLAAGILAHGLLWDLPHHGNVSFVPSWYALGCLWADLGMACYVATQVRAYDRTPLSAAHVS